MGVVDEDEIVITTKESDPTVHLDGLPEIDIENDHTLTASISATQIPVCLDEELGDEDGDSKGSGDLSDSGDSGDENDNSKYKFVNFENRKICSF